MTSTHLPVDGSFIDRRTENSDHPNLLCGFATTKCIGHNPECSKSFVDEQIRVG